ncbi:MAG: ATP-binding cassette domain-containing protein [Bacteroidota bacterium]|nr:ATP-binding cassette domain-containing protein [Bacteroidota bacterium]
MNESILRALMRLFAIVADVNKEGHSDNERDIVMDYLDRQYSHEIVQKYINYFEQQVKHSHPEISHASDAEAHKQDTINEAVITELCNQINEELEQEQKLTALIYLLDFINRGEELPESELKTITTVAQQLKLKEDEFNDAKAFTFGEIKDIIHKDRLLFIDSQESTGDPEIKHLPNEKMEGRIVVLHLTSSDTYVFRYYGRLDLFLNGHNIKPNRSYIWSGGSVIKNSKIGSLYFSRMAGKFIQAGVESKFVFTADDIEFNYRNSNNGVKRFSLTEESGRLIGIIGGSGSGKSTLLNVLNGNIRPKRGSIRINGHDIHQEKERLKGVIGFVPQDDLLIKELTVFQNLYYNAKLCFSNYSEDQIKQLVERALVDFDLIEARDLNVGDAFTTILSGGQRKRLNIALELIREPSILFVDEPNSGLSSADSEKVITLLKRQALKGKLVISNIHQPSSDVFKMFDKLLVMDQGGRIIYYGNPIMAITYFKRASHYADAEESECLSCGNINADQILRIVEARVVDANGRLTRKRKTSPEEWYKMYLRDIDVKVRKTQREHDSSVPKNNFSIPNHFKQFKIFLKRDILAKFHNKQYLFINTVEAPLLAFILAFFTKNFTIIEGVPRYIFGENTNIPAYLFMSVIVALFLGLVISAEEIFKDRKILKREKFLNLSRSSYMFSKIMILFSISALQMLAFVLIGNSMLGIKGMGFHYWLILFTTSCWANLIGLNISAGLNSVVTIYILVPLILVPQLLFSGVVVEFNKMHNRIADEKNVPVIGDMMTSRWAYEALMVAQFKDNQFEKYFYSSEKVARNAIYYKSYEIPELRMLISESNDLKSRNIDTIKLGHRLLIVKNELLKICKDLNWSVPKTIDSVNVANYNTKISNSVISFINKSEKEYIRQYNDAINERDSRYDKLVKQLGGDDKFVVFKQTYYNKQVADIVTNEKEITEYSIQDGEMVRIKDAVYRTPDSRNWRSHFYAPIKHFLSMKLDTFWFNLMFIWMFSGFLFVLLYYDILRRIILYFDTLRLNRYNRRRFLRLWVSEQPDMWKSGSSK